MDLKSTYNRIAKDWMQDHQGDSWWVAGIDKFVSMLSAGSSVLDVGCGAGQKTKYLIGHGLKVTGIDFSVSMIELAKRDVPRADFFVMDITEPLSLEATFDGVFAQAVLLHVPKKDIKRVIKNIVEPLKPGGYFYAAVKQLVPGKPEEEVLRENDYGYDYERFFSYYTLPEFKEYMETAGIKILYDKIASSGPTNWIQIVGQKVGA